jgi:hypothetical protein
MWKFAFHKETYQSFQHAKGQIGGIKDKKGFSTLTGGLRDELVKQENIVCRIKEEINADPASHTKEKLDKEFAKLKELKAKAGDPSFVTDVQWNLNELKNHVMSQEWSRDVQGNWTPTLEQLVRNAAENFTGKILDQDIVHQKNGLGGEAYSVKLDHNWRVTCAVVTGECGNPVLVAHVFMSDHSPSKTQRKEYECVIGARDYRIQGPE